MARNQYIATDVFAQRFAPRCDGARKIRKKASLLTTYPLISVIDDDLSVRAAIDDLLKSSGYSTSVFGTADGFLSSMALWESDCVVSDVEMPGTSGLELLSFLRKNRIDAPFILMSARAGGSTPTGMTGSGVFNFIEKPFSPERFLELVNSSVRQGSSQRRMIG